jgi:hypothetical protein
VHQRQGEPVQGTAFGAPVIGGIGQQSGTYTWTPPSSTSAGWGATIRIDANTCAGTASHEGLAQKAAPKATGSFNWNVSRQDSVTCPGGTTVNSTGSSGGGCSPPFEKLVIDPPAFTETTDECDAGEGNPCFPSTGNKSVTEPAFRYGAIAFDLHYNSLRQTRPYSYIDRNWSHSFAKRVITDDLVVLQPGGCQQLRDHGMRARGPASAVRRSAQRRDRHHGVSVLQPHGPVRMRFGHGCRRVPLLR